MVDTHNGIILKEKRLLDLGIGRELNGKIILHPIEYAYAIEQSIIKGDKKVAERIMRENNKEYRVFSFLMKRGYVCRLTLGSNIIRVGRKGFRKKEERTKYVVMIKDEINMEELVKDLDMSLKMRKKLVYAIPKEKIKFISIENKVFV